MNKHNIKLLLISCLCAALNAMHNGDISEDPRGSSRGVVQPLAPAYVRVEQGGPVNVVMLGPEGPRCTVEIDRGENFLALRRKVAAELGRMWWMCNLMIDIDKCDDSAQIGTFLGEGQNTLNVTLLISEISQSDTEKIIEQAMKSLNAPFQHEEYLGYEHYESHVNPTLRTVSFTCNRGIGTQFYISQISEMQIHNDPEGLKNQAIALECLKHFDEIQSLFMADATPDPQLEDVFQGLDRTALEDYTDPGDVSGSQSFCLNKEGEYNVVFSDTFHGGNPALIAHAGWRQRNVLLSTILQILDS